MSRPSKNNCDYFPHDAGMRNHKKVKSIRTKFGIQGYGIWSMLLEHLTGSDGNVFPYTELEFELMSGDFGVSVTEIRDVVDYCIRLEMLFNKNGFISSESLDERLAPVFEKRHKAKQLSKQQLRSNGKYVTEMPHDTVVTVTEMPQSKVKESKVKESKVDYIPCKHDTIETRENNFRDKLIPYIEIYGKEMLREFFDYWTEKNEGAKKMKFEMQKVFEIEKRLSKWSRNNFSKNNNSSNTKKLDIQSELEKIIAHGNS